MKCFSGLSKGTIERKIIDNTNVLEITIWIIPEIVCMNEI